MEVHQARREGSRAQGAGGRARRGEVRAKEEAATVSLAGTLLGDAEEEELRPEVQGDRLARSERPGGTDDEAGQAVDLPNLGTG